MLALLPASARIVSRFAGFVLTQRAPGRTLRAMRNKTLAMIGVIGLCAVASYGQQATPGGRGGGPPAQAVPDLATGRTMFWSAADIDARWREHEALKRNHSRLFN